jgi:hypothetical protein
MHIQYLQNERERERERAGVTFFRHVGRHFH